jgi:hypothetical protein
MTPPSVRSAISRSSECSTSSRRRESPTITSGTLSPTAKEMVVPLLMAVELTRARHVSTLERI